ncbi:hypothetical protein ACVWYH_007226 [Bradyrhizobium sp. GM24.11]
MITSSRRVVTSDLSVWSSIDTSRSLQRDRETRLSQVPREGGSGTTLTKARVDQPKGKLAEAIHYALSRWEGLTRFIEDGRIELDNNAVERSIRPIALNRKNTLFAGSDGGAEHWAIIASLVETCKLNDLDPLAYLTDALTRVVNGHERGRN